MLNCHRFLKPVLLSFMLSTALGAQASFSCTRLLKADKGEAVMVGRNMDWLEDMQANLWVYPRGLSRDGMAPVNSLKWTSKYGSLIASAYNAITTDGMNEKGLAAHLLALPESDYGKRDEGVPAMSVLMWAQYYLDNFQTVDEAVKFTQTAALQLLPYYSPNVKRVVNVHLALEDASGDSAIIEYVNGKPVIYHDRNYTVLTNSPTYDMQLQNIKRYQGFGGDMPLPGTTNPQDRFVRAAYYTAHLPAPVSDKEEVFEILSVLQNAGQPYGMPAPERPIASHSIWRIVADLSHGVYYYNSLTSFNIIWARLDQFNLMPGAPIMKLDVVNHTELAGDVTADFIPV